MMGTIELFHRVAVRYSSSIGESLYRHISFNGLPTSSFYIKYSIFLLNQPNVKY